MSRKLAGLLLGCVLLAGCAKDVASEEPVPQPEFANRSFAAIIENETEAAIAAGASEEQLRVLELARERGDMSVELARTAFDAYFECLEGAGVGHQFLGHSGRGEYPSFDYRVATDDAVAAGCYDHEFRFVDSVYQLQPAAYDFVAGVFAEKGDTIRECLAAGGYDLPADATFYETRLYLFFALSGLDPDDREAPENPDRAVDCVTPIGLTLNEL